MESHQVPDLDAVKQAIDSAREAEERLLRLDHNAIVHDEGFPGMSPPHTDARRSAGEPERGGEPDRGGDPQAGGDG